MIYENIQCSSCKGVNITFGKCEAFGIPRFQSGYVYYCKDCGAYVGTHKNDPSRPMGTPADKKTRSLRNKCHRLFDQSWETTGERMVKYHILAQKLNIPDELCHFGMMDYKQLTKAIDIIKSWE